MVSSLCYNIFCVFFFSFALKCNKSTSYTANKNGYMVMVMFKGRKKNYKFRRFCYTKCVFFFFFFQKNKVSRFLYVYIAWFTEEGRFFPICLNISF